MRAFSLRPLRLAGSRGAAGSSLIKGSLSPPGPEGNGQRLSTRPMVGYGAHESPSRKELS